MLNRIKDIAKRSHLLTRAHWWYQFARAIPVEEFLATSKMRLIFRAAPKSQCSFQKLSKLHETASFVETEGVAGSFVECGTRNGGSAAIMAAVAAAGSGRHAWFFDSWEGLPEPMEHDVTHDGLSGRKGQALGYREQVEALLFRELELDPARIHLVQGWFQKTVPIVKEQLGEIALLNLDCDWYESVKFCLQQLYPLVAHGGFVFVDDYYHWKGCQKAVDEFLVHHSQLKLVRVDRPGVYFQKVSQAYHSVGTTG